MLNCQTDGVVLFSDENIKRKVSYSDVGGYGKKHPKFPYIVSICNEAFTKLTNVTLEDFEE